MAPELSDHEIVAQYLEEEEEVLGVSCEVVHSEAMAFIRAEVRPVIDAGKRGDDWTALSSSGFLVDLDLHEDRISKCQMMNVAASSVELPVRNNFEDLHRLLSTLHAFLDPYDGESPTDRKLRPDDFELMERFYRDADTEERGT